MIISAPCRACCRAARSRSSASRSCASPRRAAARLGFGFVFGLAVSLWSANAGMKAIFDALNIVYDEKEKRSFVALNLQSLAFTFATIAFLIVAHRRDRRGADRARAIVGLGSGTEWLARLGRWPLLLAMRGCGLAVLYRYGPSRDKAQWRWVTPGGLVAAVLLARRLDAVLLVCREFRQLQRNLWLARRRDRLHDLDLDFRHRRPARVRRSMPRWNIRPPSDTTEGPHQPMGCAAPPWLTTSADRQGRQPRGLGAGPVSLSAPLQRVGQPPASTPAARPRAGDSEDGGDASLFRRSPARQFTKKSFMSCSRPRPVLSFRMTGASGKRSEPEMQEPRGSRQKPVLRSRPGTLLSRTFAKPATRAARASTLTRS